MTYEEAKNTIALGRYRHFKGKEYEVLAIARHSETKEPMVVYRALYSDETYEDGAVWIRPAAMWQAMWQETVRIPSATEDATTEATDGADGKNGKGDAQSWKKVKRFTRV